jgi:multicomponent Na+:H+ antiporter subunit F
VTETILTGAILTAVAIVAVAALLGVIAIVRAADDASRAVVADLLYFSAVSVFVFVAVLTGSAVVFDVALIAMVLGILATLAFAFMLTRGRR